MVDDGVAVQAFWPRSESAGPPHLLQNFIERTRKLSRPGVVITSNVVVLAPEHMKLVGDIQCCEHRET
jgi:hypothetical protein